MIEPSRQGEKQSRCAEEERAGEPAFWEIFARRHGRDLTRAVACAMTRFGLRPVPEEVEELVQEAYCRLLARRPDAVAARPQGQLWAYLHRIARSVVVDELRARRACKRGGGCAGRAEEEALLDVPAPGMSPEELLLASERADLLRGRVRDLAAGAQGERNLRVLELAALEGLTSGEISRRLGGELTPSSVHTVLHRLRRQLGAGRAKRRGRAAEARDEVVTSPVAAVG